MGVKITSDSAVLQLLSWLLDPDPDPEPGKRTPFP